MPNYSTHLLIKELQEQTENNINLAVSQWQMIPHSQFSKKPAPGSWSANESVQHLNSYGLYYLPAIEHAIEHAAKHVKNAPVFHSGWLGNYFTGMMMTGANNKPAKNMQSPKEHQPTGIIESHIVISTFIDQQEKLLQLLEAAKEVDLNRIRVPISITKFIRLKLGDTFNFMVVHIYRHVLQVQRALGPHTTPNIHDGISLRKAWVTS